MNCSNSGSRRPTLQDFLGVKRAALVSRNTTDGVTGGELTYAAASIASSQNRTANATLFLLATGAWATQMIKRAH
eukprot:7360188-Lingulodinium_polyedra.AAC.1